MRPILLLVEEDKSFLEAILSVLSTDDFQIVISPAAEAEEFFKRLFPDLILLGTDLSREEGLKLARQMQQVAETFSVPIVLITTEVDARNASLVAGFTEVIIRPFSLTDLPDKINHILFRRFYPQIRKTHNPITGLPGYEDFREQLSYLFSFARRYRRHFSLVMVQIENWTEAKTSMAEEKKNQVLREVANRLKQNVKSLDLVMQYSEGEFAVLLPMTGNSGVKVVVRRLEHTMGRLPVKFLNGTQKTVTLFFGGAAYSRQQKSPNEIFILAEEHLRL
ncbi:MAG: diguanylate cyclase, partial [Candidatus Omnitrophica bacterium]|nr:diguanylate cyclase [Candidatus Omnitrophota bacterium]